MTALTTITEEAKKLIEKVFLKTSFLIVLVSLFWISQLVNNATAMKYFPFIQRLNAQDNHTTYTVTLAMLLLLSRGLSWAWDWIKNDNEIEKLKKQYKREFVEISERNDKLDEQLRDADTVIDSLYEPPRNARDFLYDIRDRKGFEAFYLQDFCYITYTNRNNFTYTIAKISYISNNSKDFNAKTHVSIKQILEEHREILKEHKNNIETLTYEPPHILANNR